MKIKRDIYLNGLIVRKHNGFIKVITGMRRCGKSYLFNNLFYDHLLFEDVKKVLVSFLMKAYRELQDLELSLTVKKVGEVH